MSGVRRAGGVLCLAAAVVAAAAAQSNTTYNFLRADVGARAGAMAGAFVAVPDDPACLFYNPAGLALIDRRAASLGFFKHLLDVNAGSLAYAHPLEGAGVLAAGIVYFNYGSFDETDDLGNTLGTFTASDIAFSAGFAGTLEEDLTYGASAKLISSSIAGYTSTGLGIDAGVLYRMPESRITVGAGIRNLGAQLSTFAGTREDLPADLSVGGSIVPKGLPLLFTVNFHKLNERGDTFADRFRAFSIGGEFTLSAVLRARFGYNNEQRRELKMGTSAGLAGFSGGVGIVAGDYVVDYALSSLGKVGSLHRIAVGTRF